MTKIGMIGSGNMGRALGVRLADLGYPVFFGARDPSQSAAAAKLAGHDSDSGDIDAAAQFGEMLVWTTRESDPAKVLKDVSDLSGKIVVDLNNRDYATEAKSGAWFSQSIAEKLQANAPNARIVKAFNTMAMESFDIPPAELRAAGAQTFLAGSDAEAKQQVGNVARALGFEPVDLGVVPAAYRAAEALGDVIRLLMIDGERGSSAHLTLTMLPQPSLGAIGERSTSQYK